MFTPDLMQLHSAKRTALSWASKAGVSEGSHDPGSPGGLLQNPESAFHRSEALRVISEKAFVDWQYREKWSRARNAKVVDYNITLLETLSTSGVFKARVDKPEGIKKGAYAGPARILAMETRERDGQLRPRSSVWLIRGMRLIKAAIEQLRPATEREQAGGKPRQWAMDHDQTHGWTRAT